MPEADERDEALPAEDPDAVFADAELAGQFVFVDKIKSLHQRKVTKTLQNSAEDVNIFSVIYFISLCVYLNNEPLLPYQGHRRQEHP